MRADPLRQVTSVMYLSGATLGKRRLYIAFVNNVDQKNHELQLLCSEDLSNGEHR
jgi:hypothetical protein